MGKFYNTVKATVNTIKLGQWESNEAIFAHVLAAPTHGNVGKIVPRESESGSGKFRYPFGVTDGSHRRTRESERMAHGKDG